MLAGGQAPRRAHHQGRRARSRAADLRRGGHQSRPSAPRGHHLRTPRAASARSVSGPRTTPNEILNTLEVNLSKFIAAVHVGRERLQGKGRAARSRVSSSADTPPLKKTHAGFMRALALAGVGCGAVGRASRARGFVIVGRPRFGTRRSRRWLRAPRATDKTSRAAHARAARWRRPAPGTASANEREQDFPRMTSAKAATTADASPWSSRRLACRRGPAGHAVHHRRAFASRPSSGQARRPHQSSRSSAPLHGFELSPDQPVRQGPPLHPLPRPERAGRADDHPAGAVRGRAHRRDRRREPCAAGASACWRRSSRPATICPRAARRLDDVLFRSDTFLRARRAHPIQSDLRFPCRSESAV